eukprot:4288329-Amphidinium_carterae.1
MICRSLEEHLCVAFLWGRAKIRRGFCRGKNAFCVRFSETAEKSAAQKSAAFFDNFSAAV